MLAELRPVAPPTPPAPTGPVQCGTVGENEVLPLACADGSVITAISFASFGTPTGTCPGKLAKGSCDANSTLAIVEKACLGKTSCAITASRDVFGDP